MGHYKMCNVAVGSGHVSQSSVDSQLWAGARGSIHVYPSRRADCPMRYPESFRNAKRTDALGKRRVRYEYKRSPGYGRTRTCRFPKGIPRWEEPLGG